MIFKNFTRESSNSIPNKCLASLTAKLEAEGFFLDEQSIEQYHLGELSPELIPIFEKRRSEDPLFAQQIEEFEAMIKGLEAFQEENELKSSLANVEVILQKDDFFEPDDKRTTATELPPQVAEPRIKTLKMVYRIAIAASFILFLGIGLRFLVGNPFPSIELFAQNASLPEGKLLDSVMISLFEMDGPSKTDTIFHTVALEKALAPYEQGSYDTAYQHLQRYVARFPRDKNGQFYLGVASLHVKDYPRAEKAFQMLMKHPNSKFFESAQWFLAVTELETNPERGKQRIKAIAKGEASPYRKTAQKIVRRYRLK